MRSLAREVVFQYTFSEFFCLNDEGLFNALIKQNQLNEDDKNFALSLSNAIKQNKEKYIDVIDNLTNKFDKERVFKTDKCALLIGIAELNAFPETPVLVVIDETVKLAYKFSTEKSTDFVNGVIAEYARQIGKL